MTTPSAPAHNRLRGASLRVQAMLIMGGILAVILGGYIAYLSFSLIHSLAGIQNEITLQRLEHVVRRFEKIAQRQQIWVRGEAVSDEAVRAVRARDAGFLSARLEELRQLTASPGWIAVFDRQKNLVYGVSTDGVGAAKEGLPDGISPECFRHSELLGDNGQTTAIKNLPGGTLVVSSYPILHSSGAGPSPGWILIGQLLDPAWYAENEQITDVVAQPAASGTDPAAEGYSLRKTLEFGALGICRIYSKSGPNWGTHGVLVEFAQSITRDPAQLRADVPSRIFSTAVSVRNRIVWLSVAVGILLTASCLLAIEFLFVRRIVRIDLDLQELASNPGTTLRLNPTGNDEFARLARSANKLFESLRRRRGEAESQQKLLSGVLDSASEGILALRTRRDAEGAVSDFLIVLANRSAEKIIKLPPGRVVGLTLLEMVPSAKEIGLFKRLLDVIETDQPVDEEFLLNSPMLDGWFHISATPWKDGLVVTFEEISDRKRTEQELQRNLEEIERFNRAMIGRENRILEMKTEVNDLRKRLGLEAAYRVDSRSDDV